MCGIQQEFDYAVACYTLLRQVRNLARGDGSAYIGGKLKQLDS
jgi:hypothetical protein